MTAPTYTVEYCDEMMWYEIVEWTELQQGARSGKAVFKSTSVADTRAMLEEFQHTADAHDWAQHHAAEWEQYHSQESEFGYYGA